VADGADTLALALMAADAFGNPVAGAAVSFASSGEGDTLTPGATTGSDGHAAATLTSTKAGTRTITASFAGTSVTTSVQFVAGPPDVAHSSLTGCTAVRTADGADGCPLLVTVADARGNVAADVAVAFEASGSGNTFTSASSTTGAGGKAGALLKSTHAERKTVTARVGGAFDLTIAALFVPGPVDAAASSLRAFPGSAAADGNAQLALAVIASDAHGNPIAGQQVSFSSPSAADLFAPQSGQTGADGSLAAVVTSTLAGTRTLSAALGTVAAEAQVQFTTGAAAGAAVAADGAHVADGSASAALTVSVQDAHGNGVAGQAVTLAVSGSNNTLSTSGGRTGSAGTFRATLSSTTAEAKIVTATAAGFTASASVTFIAGAPAAVRFAAVPARGAAGERLSPARVQILDANGNLTSATSAVDVALTQATATLAGTLARSAVGGVATFDDLSIDQGGDYTLTATSASLTPATSASFHVTPQGWFAVGGAPSGYLNSITVESASRVWTASNFGVYLTADGGATWSDTWGSTAGTPSAVSAGGGAVYVSTQKGVFHWSGSGWVAATDSTVKNATVLAAAPLLTTTAIVNGTGGIFRTTDGGATWTNALSLGTSSPIQGLAWDPSNSLIAYATGVQYVYRSTDGGASWSPCPSLGAQVIYNVAVDPVTPTNVYVSAALGFFSSTNSGASWSGPYKANGSSVNAFVLDPGTPGTIWASGSTSGSASAITSGPLYKSTDSGQTWTSANSGLTDGPRALAAASAGSYWAAVGNGAFHSGDAGATWTRMGAGLQESPSAVTALGQTVIAYGSNNLNVSGDGGLTWRSYAPFTGIFGAGVQSVAIAPSATSTIYALDGNSARVYLSTDGAQSFTKKAALFGNALAVSPDDASTLVGANCSTIYRSSDGWTTTQSASLPSGSCAHSLLYDGKTHGTLWAAGSGGVWRSTDAGVTWSTAGLAGNTHVNGITQDPTNPQILYVAASSDGAYRTTDGGATWNKLTLPGTAVFTTAVDAAGTAFFATDQGVFLADGTSASLHLPASNSTVLCGDAVAPGALFAMTTRGLFASATGGR
jgi:photosystem II stability/assembly factor-like uncharacterized protein